MQDLFFISLADDDTFRHANTTFAFILSAI